MCAGEREIFFGKNEREARATKLTTWMLNCK